MNSSRSIITCYAALFFGIVLLIFVFKDFNMSISNKSNDEWVQPKTEHNLYSRPISEMQWNFDYQKLEKILTEIKWNNGSLLINDDLDKILHAGVLSLPKNLSQISIDRLLFLIEKQFPKSVYCKLNHCHEISLIFYQYYKYHNDNPLDKISLGIIETPIQELELLDQERNLKREYFGEIIATGLFGKDLRLREYLIKRKIIKSSIHLSSVEKIKRLINLRKSFQVGL